jgi:hypothetical protein
MMLNDREIIRRVIKLVQDTLDLAALIDDEDMSGRLYEIAEKMLCDGIDGWIGSAPCNALVTANALAPRRDAAGQ